MSDFLRVPMIRVGEQFLSPSPHGARTRESKPAGGDDPNDYPDPDYVYVVYLKPLSDSDWMSWHLYSRIAVNADATAADLLNQAQNNDSTNKIGENLVDLVWKKPCFLYLILDSDSADFIDDEFPEHDPLFFVARKPVLGSNPAEYLEYDENASFYNGTVLPVGGRSAFRCVNYMKDENGNDIKFPKQRFYGFEIRYLSPIGNNRVVQVIDPDGQNQGPPRLGQIHRSA